jgi:copper resistance protein C
MPTARLAHWVGVTLLAALASWAASHAYLNASEPEAYATIGGEGGRIVLAFSVAVEVRFSAFELLRLPDGFAGGGERDLDAAARAGYDALARQRLSRAAPAELLQLEVEPTRGSADRIELWVEGGLAPGAYALTYRVLAVDGHMTDGLLVFFVADP